MNLLHRILPRVSVLAIVWQDAARYDLTWYVCRLSEGWVDLEREEKSPDISATQKTIGQYPLVVLAGGYGVISKEVGSATAIVGQVTADPGNFLWTFSADGQTISFVRRSQLEDVSKMLADAGLTVDQWMCSAASGAESAGTTGGEPSGFAASGTPEDTVRESASHFASARITFRNMIRPEVSGSTVALHVARKAKLPVLGVLLMALVANVLIGGNLREKYARQHTRVQALQSDRSRDSQREQQNRQLIEQVGRTLPYRYAWLCDRVAAAIPPEVTLTRMAVQPLGKALENNILPVIYPRTIVIQGESASSGEISRYVSALGKEPFGKGLKLSSVERNRENDLFVFRIDLML